MKHSRTIFILILSFFLVSIPVSAQKANIFRRLFKKEVEKEVVYKTTKEFAEDLAEKTIKKRSQYYIPYKHSGISKEQAQELLGKSADASVDLIKWANPSVTIKSYDRTFGGRVYSKDFYSKLSIKELDDLSRIELNYHMAKYASKSHDVIQWGKVVNSASEVLMKDITRIFGERFAKIWKEICGDNFEKYTKILLSDISKHRSLLRALKKNPDLLKAYRQLIESVYRTDLTLLRYINYNAGKFARGNLKIAKLWGNGEDLIIKSEGAINNIYNAAGDYLGTIAGNATDGYIIECSVKNRTLLNLYPLGNATYKCHGNKWITDEYGRVKRAETMIHKSSIERESRNSQAQKDATTLKNGYNVDGTQTGISNINDEGGHIIALQHGGTNDLINFIPQSSKINRNENAFDTISQAWYRSERSATVAINNGHTVEREVNLSYKDNKSMRPDSIRLTQKIDGKIDVLKGNKYGPAVTLDNLEIPNS